MSFRKPCHMPFRKLIPPFTLTGLVVMSVADFVRNFHSPVLIKMIGRYRIGQGYLGPSNSRPTLACEQAPLGG